MTASPPDTEQNEPGQDEAAGPSPAEAFAAAVAAAVGGEVSPAVGIAKVTVEPESWVEAVTKARDEFGLVYFSFLSAIDWAKDVAVGDPLQGDVEERYEVICTLTELMEGKRVTIATNLDKENPMLGSLVSVFPGANWHEREAHEMFSIDFEGHPYLENLYLPDGFVGHPLQKSYPLLSREVKPWPGTVDVEGMPEKDEDADPDAPSTENPEA
ncbi:MAG: NADH-quinone oxidoreductase subunit C [Acidimicrobiia bacterium]|nr:NADH-quinone oxidoreductase subunit C [Acidimicrobiia bacterium]